MGIEQVRVVVDQLNNVALLHGAMLEMPAWSRSIVGGQPLSLALLACVGPGNATKTLQIACPMRFASAGVDVLNSLSGGASASGGDALERSHSSLATWMRHSHSCIVNHLGPERKCDPCCQQSSEHVWGFKVA